MTRKITLYILSLLILSSCKKFVEIDPPNNQLQTSTIFTTDASAVSAISGLYSKMSEGPGSFANGGQGSFTHLAGLSSDEFINYKLTAEIATFYTNTLNKGNTLMQSFLWGQPYNYIYAANSILEGLEQSKTVSTIVRDQLTGEAKFIRAFCHFYLVNMFGDVPLVLSTDYKLNSAISRSSKSDVYKQIVTDLLDAQSKLAEDYVFASNERVRPNKWAATALLARVYLYTKDWKNAEAQATNVINNKTLYDTVSLNNVFLKNSKEVLWQLKPVRANSNTEDGALFILKSVPTYVTLSDTLFNSFELADKRKLNWIHDTTILSKLYHYAYKYKVPSGAIVTEYLVMLRLAEQYLIRAEARAQQDNYPGALADLNLIRKRAGLPDITTNNKDSLLAAILHERQVELFTEWGHRWLDLKRTGKVDEVMTNVAPQKGSVWKSYQQLYPIPQPEIDKNRALTQNSGY